MSYDVKCYELAEAFIADLSEGVIRDDDPRVDRLAQVIQDAIEDELAAMSEPPTETLARMMDDAIGVMPQNPKRPKAR